MTELMVRAPLPGEGTVLAALWRELWELHEGWGGYASTRDASMYEALAHRLEREAHMRGGLQLIGRHIHLVACFRGQVVGQVEGWFERHGTDPTTALTCEVRSLIVSASKRGLGAGRALLETLGRVAVDACVGPRLIVVAEVLEVNPAREFYRRVGYAPVAFCGRMELGEARVGDRSGFRAALAEPRDALPLALLEAQLTERRRAVGDFRFDRPRAVDATLLGDIALRLGRQARSAQAGIAGVAGLTGPPLELVVRDAGGTVCAAATITVGTLDSPFVPARRAMLGRIVLDPARCAEAVLAPLVGFARGCALMAGAVSLELTDLPAPRSALHQAALAVGARPWTQVVAWSPWP